MRKMTTAYDDDHKSSLTWVANMGPDVEDTNHTTLKKQGAQIGKPLAGFIVNPNVEKGGVLFASLESVR